jgi:hypothetical protein
LEIAKALEENGFSRTGAMKSYYYIDGRYVDSAVYEYPHKTTSVGMKKKRTTVKTTE